MRLLVDANVVLDVLQDRSPFVEDSLFVWRLCETKQAEGFVSTLTFANIVYVMRKELDPTRICSIFNGLSLVFTFTELSTLDLARAEGLGWKDFEDAIQSATAERLRADYIVTRDIQDFAKSTVPAILPSDLALMGLR